MGVSSQLPSDNLPIVEHFSKISNPNKWLVSWKQTGKTDNLCGDRVRQPIFVSKFRRNQRIKKWGTQRQYRTRFALSRKKTVPRKDDAMAKCHLRNLVILRTPSLKSCNFSHLTSWHSRYWDDRCHSNFTRVVNTLGTILEKKFRLKEKRSVFLVSLEPIGGLRP
jgi:hypothetical protein